MIKTNNLTKVFGNTTEVMEYWNNGVMDAAPATITPTLQHSSL